MEIVKIDGKVWKVRITSISESFTILYSENSGRTMAAGSPMALDPLGTFYNYKIKFKRIEGEEKEYDDLFDFFALPRYDGVEFNIIHNQALWNKPFKAYVSQGERALKRVDVKTGKVYWDEFTANIVPISAQVLPV